jgi:predicted nucleic acid-binding protein
MIIAEVKPYLDQLRILAGFRISDALYLRVLADEHESK